ncbi:MAG: histidine kinase [Polyangia bacterium]
MVCDISERLAAEQQQERHRRRQKELVRNATTALGETRAELQALSRHLMTAQEEERSRLARELHDDLGQQTALLELEIARLQQLLPAASTEAQRLLASLRARSRVIEDGLRCVSHRLPPSALEDLGLVQALRMLVEEHRRCGRDICLVAPTHELPLLPRQTKTALYRIAQEALRNASKHAPRAPVRLVLSASTARPTLLARCALRGQAHKGGARAPRRVVERSSPAEPLWLRAVAPRRGRSRAPSRRGGAALRDADQLAAVCGAAQL